MSSRKILVVAGDYELIHQTRQALTDLGFSFFGAYSHRDALYALRNGDYNAIVVDGRMSDRRTGELTSQVLSNLGQDAPVIVFQPDAGAADDLSNGQVGASGTYLRTLDDPSVRQVVLHALHHHTVPIKQTINLKGRDDAEYWDVDEVQTFLALTRSLTEVLDLSEVLNRVVSAARQLTDAEEGMILLPDGDSPELYLRARVGMDLEVARNFRVKTEDTVAGQVFRSGQPVLIGAKGPQKVKTQYFVNSLLYVPILLKGQTLGVLGVNNRTKHDVFNSHHETLLLNLAAYAAIAIENARVHGQSMRRARELRALVDASEAINASLSLEHTLAAICEQIIRALGVHVAEVYEADRAAGRLCPAARYSLSIWRQGQEPRLALADFPTVALAVREHQPQLVRRGKPSSKTEIGYVLGMGAYAMLALPIVAQSEVFGVLNLFYLQKPEKLPSSESLQSAQYMALEALIELLDKGRSISSSITRLMEQVNQLCGSDWCECGLLSREHDAVIIHLSLGRATWIERPQNEIVLSEYPDLVEALDTQNLINQHIEGDVLTPGVHKLLEATRGRSILGLPLVFGGQTQGMVLCVDTENSRTFSARETELARAVVGQAATGLENARLLRDLEQSLAQLRSAQERLIQAERLSAMGALAAAVAHQIKNPLTTIVLDTQLMLEDRKLDSDKNEQLQAILRASKRADSVVRRLLAAVRPQNDDTPPAAVQVITTIEDTLALIKSHIERDGIRIITQFPVTPVPPVWVVPGELEDAWMNLILNAQDALKGRPEPTIRINMQYEADEQVIRVIIADNGPGITDDVLNRIFDPFFTTKPIGEGTGLGLHICRQVVKRAGGQIDVQTAPGKGARFIVTLPVQKGA